MSEALQPIAPIATLELFPPLSAALIALLRELPTDDWRRPTVCGDWSVKDVAAHLLGGNLGRLSFQRDGLQRALQSRAPESNDEVVQFVNRANADWVAASARMSPRVLTDFLELPDPQVHAFFATLPPAEPARIGVSWAGETRSANWFDIAREYTEKWLHQQHIRAAVARPGMTERRFFFPVLDTFISALPYTYRTVTAPLGAAINVAISGPSGGEWALQRDSGAWRLYVGAHPSPVSRVQLPDELAWRLFTKGISPTGALPFVRIDGDRALGEHVLQMVSIVA